VRVVAHRSGQPFRIDRADPFVATFREEAGRVTGEDLPLTGITLASDLNHFVELAGIPTVLHGVDPKRAHATPEWVPVAELVRAARIYARVVGALLDET
jgi:acetylornithine deacetylase/succinyl-diaminopimelate desuccinylase-like protein